MHSSKALRSVTVQAKPASVELVNARTSSAHDIETLSMASGSGTARRCLDGVLKNFAAFDDDFMAGGRDEQEE